MLVESYRVYLSHRTVGLAGNSFHLTAQIVGYDKNNTRLFILTFGESLGSHVHENYEISSGGYRLFLKPERYPWYLDLLRNERPLDFNLHSLSNWYLFTSEREDVGEGDIDFD